MVRKIRLSAGPSHRVLWGLALGVLLLHGLLLLGVTAPLEVRWHAAPPNPVQVRVVQASPVAAPAPVARPRPAARRAPTAVDTVPVAVTTEAMPSPSAASEPEVFVPSPAQASADATPAPPVAAASMAVPATPAASAPTTDASMTAWPLIPLGALPPSRLLSYRLTGMDKGLTYHASGELRWQHNGSAYELTLSVRAFLIGSRHWRSVGQIDATGLAPRRFSDSWRNERAAHFDREQQRIVFSSNSPPAPLQPGAQDQTSLYVQLAAAVAGEPERFTPGTRLQVQTATVRDAQPWSLVMQGVETLSFDGQNLQASKWVAQPRNQYDAKVEFWVAASQGWLPVRILITQTNGSYIDLIWRGSEPLPPLPVAVETTAGAKGS
jgi:Protein of unknown function (DUF3108)